MQIWSWSGFFDYLLNPFLLEGAVTTLWLTAASLSAGLLLGIGLAVMRLSGNALLSGAAGFYCWVFRGTPLLVQLIIIYTGLPQLGIKFSVVESALLGLVLNEALTWRKSSAAASWAWRPARAMPLARSA